jgi:hypothetical protein
LKFFAALQKSHAFTHKNSPRRTGGNFLLTLKTTNMKSAEIMQNIRGLYKLGLLPENIFFKQAQYQVPVTLFLHNEI